MAPTHSMARPQTAPSMGRPQTAPPSSFRRGRCVQPAPVNADQDPSHPAARYSQVAPLVALCSPGDNGAPPPVRLLRSSWLEHRAKAMLKARGDEEKAALMGLKVNLAAQTKQAKVTTPSEKCVFYLLTAKLFRGII